jgi:ubiquinone/menaquinone biosynthesis C-methylase UbiE
MKSNIEWKKWGERDPLYAVSTWEGKDRDGPDPWTDDDFYELGRSDWHDFELRWEQYGLSRRCCVEIGCGAGRITKQLSNSFGHVSALDVSQHQLDYAKSRIAASNVDFLLTDGFTFDLPDNSCSAAFSTHVFQHFDSHADAFRVIGEIHRVLEIGGTLMIHLPIYELPDLPGMPLFRALIRLLKKAGNIRAALNRRRLAAGKWTFVMRRLRFERSELINALRHAGFDRIEFRDFPLQSNGHYHPVVLATKRLND